jgi:hypothetical protein
MNQYKRPVQRRGVHVQQRGHVLAALAGVDRIEALWMSTFVQQSLAL